MHIRSALDSIPAYTPGRDLPGTIKLASNETTSGPLPSVLAVITEAALSVNRYPDNGASAVCDGIAAHLGVSPQDIFVGCGSVSILKSLVEATCDPGDEVIFAWRSFEAYPLMVRLADAKPVTVALDDNHRHDLDAMAQAVTDHTRLIFICNPNNPTGTTVSADQLHAFIAKIPSHILIAIDEAYFEYERGQLDGIDFFRTYPNMVVLRTFSKAYGLAGLRIGYAVGHREIIAALQKTSTPFSVNALAQQAAIASLRAREELLARTDEINNERIRVTQALRDAGYVVPQSEANFIWLDLGGQAVAFSDAAAQAGVILRAFAGDGVRVTITEPNENNQFLDFAVNWNK